MPMFSTCMIIVTLLEDIIDSELQELKKAHDALNKALESRRQDMDLRRQNMAEMNTARSPVKLSEVEIEDLAHSIKMESQLDHYDPLTDQH